MGADAAGRALREAAVRRLSLLDARGELSSDHVGLIATAVGVSERTCGGGWPAPGRRSRAASGAGSGSTTGCGCG